MADDLFIKQYRFVLKESDNAFSIKYKIEPKHAEIDEERGKGSEKIVRAQNKSPEPVQEKR